MNSRKMSVLLTSVLTISLLAGCNVSNKTEPVRIYKKIYQRQDFMTGPALKGDITPELLMPLTQSAVVRHNYSLNISDMEFKSLDVEIGQSVTKGQSLATFSSEKLEKDLKQYTDELAQYKMLLEHEKKLAQLDVDDKDVQEEHRQRIVSLEEDIKVAQIYVSEKQALLDKCHIVAETDGIVSFINNNLLNGVAEPDATLITVVSGEASFYCNIKTDDYVFNIGDEYTAEADDMDCKMMITKIENNDDGSRTLYFESIDKLFVNINDKKFTVHISKQTLTDVVYIPRDAVFNGENPEDYYVYVCDEEGNSELVMVEISDFIDDIAIVVSGLEGGEEVRIK